MAKSDGLLFKNRSPMSPHTLQLLGWWCGTDRARVTSRLFSGPSKQSRPMTCSIIAFEKRDKFVHDEEKSSQPPFNNKEQLGAAKR